MALATFLLGCLIFLIIFKEYRKYFLSSLIILAILTGLLIKNHKSYNDFKIIESKPFHLGLIVEKKFECIDNFWYNKLTFLKRNTWSFVEIKYIFIGHI